MDDPYYSYTIEDTDENRLYTFFSEKVKRIYGVDFNYDTYSEFLDNYPFLLSKGFALSIFDQPYSDSKIKHDSLVSSTIIHIIKDYFVTKGEETVLLYHCDHSDNRQECRHKLFERWYKLVRSTEIVKEGIEVEVPIADVKRKYFLGYLTHQRNPYLESIKEEFDAFSFNIYRDK